MACEWVEKFCYYASAEAAFKKAACICHMNPRRRSTGPTLLHQAPACLPRPFQPVAEFRQPGDGNHSWSHVPIQLPRTLSQRQLLFLPRPEKQPNIHYPKSTNSRAHPAITLSNFRVQHTIMSHGTARLPEFFHAYTRGPMRTDRRTVGDDFGPYYLTSACARAPQSLLSTSGMPVGNPLHQ